MKLDVVIKDVNPEQLSTLVGLLTSNALVKGSTVHVVHPECPPALNPVGAPSAPVNHTFVTTEEDVKARETDTASGDLDVRGFPWNEKIHSGNQGKKADGTWNKRRGVDDATVEQVENEMRALGFGHPVQSHVAPPAQAAAPTMAEKLAKAEASVGVQQPAYAPPAQQQPVYAPQTAPVAPQQPVYAPQPAYAPPAQAAPVAPQQPVYAPPAQAAPVVQQDYNGLMTKIGTLFQGPNAVTPDYLVTLTSRISQAFQRHVGAITDIANEPQMVAYAFQLIAQDGR